MSPAVRPTPCTCPRTDPWPYTAFMILGWTCIAALIIMLLTGIWLLRRHG